MSFIAPHLVTTDSSVIGSHRLQQSLLWHRPRGDVGFSPFAVYLVTVLRAPPSLSLWYLLCYLYQGLVIYSVGSCPKLAFVLLLKRFQFGPPGVLPVGSCVFSMLSLWVRNLTSFRWSVLLECKKSPCWGPVAAGEDSVF